MSNIIINKSKTYLLPLLSELVEFDKKYHNNIINTYIYDDLGKYENCFFILHKFSFRNPEYTIYENKLINNELYINLIDIDNDVLYIFKFPDDYLYEYNKYKEGKYSEFKNDAKELILNFFGEVYKFNMNAVSFLIKVKQILFKDKKLKKIIEDELNVTLSDDAELSSIMNKEEETFNISKYINTEDNDKNKDKKIIS
jgi:hypothetical protein